MSLSATILNTSANASSYNPEEVTLRKGKKIYRKKCALCHTFRKGQRHTLGPNLWNIFSRKIAKAPGYPTYSAAIKKLDGVWSYEFLNAYMENPKAALPGTNMFFPGLKKLEDRMSVLLYIRELHDTPPEAPVFPLKKYTPQ